MNSKHILISILSLLILTLNTDHLYAQIFDNDQAHPSEKWRSIDRDNFRLIFPKSFEPAAQSLAKELDVFIAAHSQSLGIKLRKTSFILQGNHIYQNGYVQLAPRKSELYPIPSAIADNQEWLPNLALHELRHVAQFDKLTGRIKGPFFEQLALALFGLNLPAWYFEGDAVLSETRYSSGGRGRLPAWEMPIRANILTSKSYSFSKYAVGSFRDNVASYYNIGYLMNAYLSNNFGLDSQEKILENMRKKLIRPYNFQRALKSVSGLNSEQLFQHTMQDLALKWKSEKPAADPDVQPIATQNSRYPSDFLLPQIDSTGRLFVLKSSPQILNQILIIDSLGNEKNILKTGLQLAPYFHLRGSEITWDEYRKDPRFGKRSYNIINIYDLQKKELRSLSSKSRYYNPSLHPSKNELVVIEVLADNSSRIVILDSKNGRLLDSLAAPKGTHLQQPKYNKLGDKIILIAVNKQGTTLLECDLRNRDYTAKLPVGNQQLERPSYQDEAIIYKAHYAGIDNIYRLSGDKSAPITRLTDAEFGAFNPFLSPDGSLIFNDYKYNGYKLARKRIDKTAITDSLQRSNYIEKSLKTLPPTQNEAEIADYLVKKYNPNANLINFHSLSISSSNFESFDNYIPGLFWLSNDLLNTTQIKLGYEYDTDINKSIYSAELSYRKYLPIFTLKYLNRGQVGTAVNSQKPNTTLMYDYREHLTTFNISLPFSIYRQENVYSYGVNLGTSYSKRYDLSLALKNFDEVIAFPMNYQVYLNKNNRLSSMDILPRWGQNLSLTYRHLPFENKMSGSILSARANFYFPGLVTNHSLQLRLAAQTNQGRYRYSYDIPMVSGWGNFNSPKVENTAMLNYRLPLAYPDWDILAVFYIKRIQGLVFSDFQNLHKDISPKSLGIGFSADFNVFRYSLPDVNFGTKLSYINDVSASKKIVPTFSLSYTY